MIVREQACIVDGCYGIYVPRTFARDFNLRDWGVSEADEEILLSGPKHEDYWETWDQVLNDAKIIIDGEAWALAQDGNLFAVRIES
jgi:hypothetical protein